MQSNEALQLPLDLPHIPAMGRDDFLIAPCNESAVALIDKWPDWPAPALILQGSAACGKTHLAAVWQSKTNAKKISPDILETESASTIVNDLGHHLIIDPLDPWIGDTNIEKTLFHLYNLLKEVNGTCLMTMRMTPIQTEFSIPDLASRLRSVPLARIENPDEAILSALMVKLFHDRQLTIDHNLINYVIPRMERSFAAVKDIVEKADSYALATKKPVNISILRKILLDGNTD